MKQLSLKSLGLRTIAAGAIASLVAACGSPTNSSYVTSKDAESVESITVDPSSARMKDTKLDIIFVMDNSQSMDNMRDEVRDGISQFVRAFSGNQYIDYRIGVTAVWDRIRFEENPNPARQSISSTDAGQKGYLLRVKNSPNGPESRDSYIHRGTTDVAKTLNATLNVSILGLTQGGPEHEELLSPVEAMFSSNIRGNGDFPRKESDVYTAVIFVSDAIDESDISALELKNLINNKKGASADKLFGYAVIAPANIQSTRDAGLVACTSNNDFDAARRSDQGNKYSAGVNPSRMMGFSNLTRGRVLSICDDNFGNKLASIGDDIVARSMKSLKVNLPHLPDASSSIKVYYGPVLPKGMTRAQRQAEYAKMQKVSRSWRYGWTYDGDTNQIVISPSVSIERIRNGMFHIDYDIVENVFEAGV